MSEQRISNPPLVLTQEAARMLRLFGMPDLAEAVEFIDAENVYLHAKLRSSNKTPACQHEWVLGVLGGMGCRKCGSTTADKS